MTTRCAVIGNPVARSLSPVLHQAAYAALGLDWTYDRAELTDSELPAFMAGLANPPWRGLSVTMPHKRAVIGYLDEVEDLARRLGAVNTVLFDPDGERTGANTDVPGFVRAFREAGVHELDAVTLLGGGATAGAAIAAVAELGASRVHCYVRDTSRAAALAAVGASFDVAVHIDAWVQLTAAPLVDAVISTIPPHAQVSIGQASSGTAAGGPRWSAMAPVLFDVGYVPTPTPFMAAAAADRVIVIGGFSLLLHQAARQVELMTGCELAPLDAMRQAGLAALSAG
jgi:shikimate dehydrogenase